MMKTNWDTTNAINFLATAIGRTTKTISFAGNKDKRAITTQKISIFAL